MYTMIWSLCALCQEPTGESLKCLATSKDVTGIAKIYTDTAITNQDIEHYIVTSNTTYREHNTVGTMNTTQEQVSVASSGPAPTSISALHSDLLYVYFAQYPQPSTAPA